MGNDILGVQNPGCNSKEVEAFFWIGLPMGNQGLTFCNSWSLMECKTSLDMGNLWEFDYFDHFKEKYDLLGVQNIGVSLGKFPRFSSREVDKLW